MEEKIRMIAEAVQNMKETDWLKIVHAINLKYSSERAKVKMTASSDEIINMIKLEIRN